MIFLTIQLIATVLLSLHSYSIAIMVSVLGILIFFSVNFKINKVVHQIYIFLLQQIFFKYLDDSSIYFYPVQSRDYFIKYFMQQTKLQPLNFKDQ